MKSAHALIILSILLCFYLPFVSADTGDNLLNNITKVTLEVPPTGTALLGTKESMTEYQSWLDECEARLLTYCNAILNIFGLNSLDWNQNTPATIVTGTPLPAVQVTALPTLTIPESPQRTTVMKITGYDGRTTSDPFTINGPYWELWYTADPLTTGGQDSVSGTGSNSAVFPSLSIQVIDKTNSDQVLETIEPPGGLDKTLWERSGIDPRPWIQKFYEGYKEYSLVITAKNVKSYIVEARVPVQTDGESGSGTPTASSTFIATPTGTSPTTYIVAVDVFRENSGIRAIYQGGRDAASLQYITINVNGVDVGEMGSENGQTPLPVGTRATFPVTDTGSGFYVTGIGHFTGGVTQKIFETTL
jgi:hypothetical protein